jgi:hypothetical protein
MSRRLLLILWSVWLISCSLIKPPPSHPKEGAKNWCDFLADTELAQFKCMRLIGQTGLGSWGPIDNINQNHIGAIISDRGPDKLRVDERGTVLPTYRGDLTATDGGSATFKLQSISPWAPELQISASGSSKFTTTIEMKNLRIRSLEELAPTLMRRAFSVHDRADPSYFSIRQALHNLCRPDQFIVTEVLVGTPNIVLSSDEKFSLGASAGWKIVGLSGNSARDASSEWKLQPEDDKELVLAAHIVNLHDALEQERLCSQPPPPASN